MYIDQSRPIVQSERNLPHWYQDETATFVTFRLADSVPAALLVPHQLERKRWLDKNPKPWTDDQYREHDERFETPYHRWLDQGMGACFLKRYPCVRAVTDSLHFFEGRRYNLDSWVVMPNHVHLIIQPIGDEELGCVLHSIKSFTANQLNRMNQRRGSCWQHESYDRLVRNPSALFRFREYIRRNPENAKVELASEAVRVGSGY